MTSPEAEALPDRSNVSSCLLRCKDEHVFHLKMDSEWSMDFAFPLLALLRDNGNERAAYQRALEICHSNYMLDTCLQKCNNTTEQRILRMGLEPWRDICVNLKTLRTQFTCWKDHIDTLILACHLESHRLREHMELLTRNDSLVVLEKVCRGMNVLAVCSIGEYSKYCGSVTKALVLQLFRSSKNSVLQMLRVRWEKLPESCTEPFVYDESDEQSMALNSACDIRTLPSAFFALVLLFVANFPT